MTAADASFLGIAKQTAKGTMVTGDASFDYLLFTGAGMGPNNQLLPLDQEAGGGAMTRSIEKSGYFSGGTLEFIPRPKTLGHFLMGALGSVTATGVAAPYIYKFKLGSDQFDAPYYTLREAPGNLWGESAMDCRLQAFSLQWKAANFVRAQARWMGGQAFPGLSTASWSPAAKTDGRPPFITANGKIEVPDGTALKVIAGSFTAQLDIPLEEQWVVGSYMPNDFAINQRGFTMSLAVLVTPAEATLYKKILYDPAASTGWMPDVLREGLIDIELQSGATMDGSNRHKLSFKANGATGQAGNLALTSEPLALRSGKQIVLNVQATWLQDASLPIEVTLQNDVSVTY